MVLLRLLIPLAAFIAAVGYMTLVQLLGACF